MKTFLALAILFCVTSLASAQEGLMERVARIEQNNAAITSMLTRQKADIDNIKDDLKVLMAKVDALTKASGTQFTTTRDWAGDVSVSSQGQTVSQSYSSGQMMRGGLFRRGLFRGRLLGGGGSGGG